MPLFPATVERFSFANKGKNKGRKIYAVTAETRTGWFLGYVMVTGPDSFAYRPAHGEKWTHGEPTRESAAHALHEMGRIRGIERKEGMARGCGE